MQPLLIPAWFIVAGTKAAGLWQESQASEVGMWPAGNVANEAANETVVWHWSQGALVFKCCAFLPTALTLLWHCAHVPGITLACAKCVPWKVDVVWQVSQGCGVGMWLAGMKTADIGLPWM